MKSPPLPLPPLPPAPAPAVSLATAAAAVAEIEISATAETEAVFDEKEADLKEVSLTGEYCGGWFLGWRAGVGGACPTHPFLNKNHLKKPTFLN